MDNGHTYMEFFKKTQISMIFLKRLFGHSMCSKEIYVAINSNNFSPKILLHNYLIKSLIQKCLCMLVQKLVISKILRTSTFRHSSSNLNFCLGEAVLISSHEEEETVLVCIRSRRSRSLIDLNNILSFWTRQ